MPPPPISPRTAICWEPKPPIEKTKGKIAELQKQLRELEAAKTEQENLQIVQLVRGLNMTPQEFAAFVRGGALQAAPAPIPDFEQEDSAHEEI